MTGREGSTIGPYHLLRRLGRGGAGEVYLADGPADASLSGSGKVAIKLLAGTASDATAREIARQAQAAGALQQAHIIPFHGVVQLDDTLALVMAYAPGGSLGDTLDAVRPGGAKKLTLPLDAGVVGRLLTQIARALAAAHAAGLTHGDLKPNNIFVRTSPNGRPLTVISDFGQGVLTSAAVQLVSQSGGNADPTTWAATQLRFAAPEQLRGQVVPATDQYALAAICYLLLTGQYPVVGDAPKMLNAIAQQPVKPPALVHPNVSSETEEVLLRALAKEPEQRYPSIGMFAQALDETLAVGVASGVTQEFASLSLATPGMRGPAGSAVVENSGVRLINRTGINPRDVALAEAAELETIPAEPPTKVRRRLAIVASVAMLLAILSCVLGFQVFAGGATLPQIKLSGVGIQRPTASATPNAAANTAVAGFQATTQAVVFSDPLSSNTNHWTTAGHNIFFAGNSLHLSNSSPSAVVTTEAPKRLSLSALSAQVDMAITKGNAGDQAGLRFFVTPNAIGGENFFCYLISPQGRYEVWLHSGTQWHFVTGGYANAIKSGLSQTNTLALLAHGHHAQLFANGQYVATVTLDADGPTSGSVGMIVMDDGAEAAYTHFAIYNASH